MSTKILRDVIRGSVKTHIFPVSPCPRPPNRVPVEVGARLEQYREARARLRTYPRTPRSVGPIFPCVRHCGTVDVISFANISSEPVSSLRVRPSQTGADRDALGASLTHLRNHQVASS